MLENQENLESQTEEQSVEKSDEKSNEKSDEKLEISSEEASLENDAEAASDEALDDIEDKVAEDAEKVDEKNSIPMLAYEEMDLELLTDELAKLIKNEPVQQLKDHIAAIKIAFNKQFGTLLAEKKAAFLAEGGDSIDFQFSSPVKTTYNSLLSEYKTKRDTYYAALDSRLKGNLEMRHQVIDELKNLIENAEPATMYKLFKDLQNRWREIGPVPRNKYNITWRNYHHHVERFYDLLDLSNDFRDVDFKNNLEEKLKLIVRVNELAEAADINESFKELQEIHKIWKEDIGPVSKEIREEVWQKFSEASKKVHDKRHEYFKEMRSQYQEIIDAKLEIITQIESYDTSANKKHSDWQRSIKEIEALRKAFINSGKLPYSKSDQVWKKFKGATKKFNREKNQFYKEEKQLQYDNLDKKNALIELAESVKDSDDWEATTNIVKKIQSDWKKIGHVPRKFSDPIWKQFKAACNHYFDRLHNRQTELNQDQQVSVDEKKLFLDKVMAVDKATVEEINEFISNWRALGTLPKAVKFLESKFRKKIDDLLDLLDLSTEEKVLLKFKNSIESLAAENDVRKLNSEQQFIRKKVDEYYKENQQLENNLSFFSSDSENNPLFKNVLDTINKNKAAVKIWELKLDLLRKLDY